MNALDLMKQDHDRLKQLFADALKDENPEARASVLHRIRAELMAHEKMEEDVFYPALREGGEKAKEIVLEGYQDHHIIEVILDELLEVPQEAEHWQAKLKVLRENLEHHIEEEEGEMFKRAKEALGEETLERLGREMQQVKEAASV